MLSRFTDQADLERKGSIDVFSLRITWRYSLEIQHASTKDEYDIGGRTSRTLRAIVICLASLLGFLAILFIAAFLYVQLLFNCSTIVNPRSNPRREWSDFKEQPFAVGFDLTAGYG